MIFAKMHSPASTLVLYEPTERVDGREPPHPETEMRRGANEALTRSATAHERAVRFGESEPIHEGDQARAIVQVLGMQSSAVVLKHPGQRSK
jgi:hypothetical protein